jgi:hypothetical protein
MTEPRDPFNRGAAAFAAWMATTPPEMALMRNPYPHGSDEFAEWRTGWQDAQRADEIAEQERAGHFRDRRPR